MRTDVVVFIDENGGGPGVRLNPQSSFASTNEQRRAISDRQAVPSGGPPMT